jgi:hypothetical protein
MSQGRSRQNTMFIREVLANGGSRLQRYLRAVDIAEEVQQQERDRINRLRSERCSFRSLCQRFSPWTI